MTPTATPDLFDRVAVIDVDTHLTEPPDTWVARVPSSMHDAVPHVERIDGNDVWMAGGERLGHPGYYSMAGFDGVMPVSIPKTFEEIPDAMYDADARLAFLDDQGIRAQVLYPNVGGFGNGYFLRLGDRELVAQCVRAYNDFLHDWCSADPERLLAVTAIPFWDVDLAISELRRGIELGHRAVNFCNQPQAYDQPPLAHPHWDPVWAAAQEAGISVSFHVGGGWSYACGWLQKFTARCPSSMPRRSSVIARSMSQNGIAVTASRRSGSALHQSWRKSLYARTHCATSSRSPKRRK